jgi:hypothetical protein
MTLRPSRSRFRSAPFKGPAQISKFACCLRNTDTIRVFREVRRETSKQHHLLLFQRTKTFQLSIFQWLLQRSTSSHHELTSGLVEEAMLELKEAGASEAVIDTFKKMTRFILLSTEFIDYAFEQIKGQPRLNPRASRPLLFPQLYVTSRMAHKNHRLLRSDRHLLYSIASKTSRTREPPSASWRSSRHNSLSVRCCNLSRSM